ncbi:zf-HC2 domain-containing protein [Methylomonas sp. AM2-LC]|uniref:anti-sigma factor family protein n=1 Tax=Methylomonas sp. AM2-LC TaxID=3153301 RepID=UPI003263852D
MNCENMANLIHAYHDNQLDLPVALDIEAHLHECEHCRTLLSQLNSLRNQVQAGMHYQRTPDNLRLALQKIGKEPDKQRSALFRFNWPLNLIKPLASFAILLLAISIGFQSRNMSHDELLADEVVSGHIRSLMVNHLTDVASSDQHTVKPWFNGKLDYSPQVKDFVAQDFQLLGGRLDFLDSRPVTALVYKRRQHIINVFIWPDSISQHKNQYNKELNGFNIIAFKAHDMNYWLVSDLNQNELMELKNDLDLP